MNQSTLIHCKPDYLPQVKELGLYYTINQQLDEVDVKVPSLIYDPNHYYVDQGEQLCDHYGIDYDQVNYIETV